MKTIFKIIGFSIILFTFHSCILEYVTGSRNVTTENREISSSINQLKVSQGIDVFLTQQDEINLSVEADDNIHELLITEVKDSVLKIYFKKNVRNRKASKVYLTLPNLTNINTSSGSEVNGVNTFEVTNIKIDASSGSEINLRINAQDILVNSSSGSYIKLTGNCQFLNANSSSGSEINAKELEAQNAQANASSGSDIDLNATKKFSGKASSGGSIQNSGKAEDNIIEKSSGGNIITK